MTILPAGTTGSELVAILLCAGTIGIVFIVSLVRYVRRRRNRPFVYKSSSELNRMAIEAARQKRAENERYKNDGGI